MTGIGSRGPLASPPCCAGFVTMLAMFLGEPTLLRTSIAVGQGERVPEAAVIDGVPRGMFVGRSLLTGRAVCLLFLSGGRITRAIPTGGLESFDWSKHQAHHSGDVGQWTINGGRLRVVWGDGGVHEGALTLRPDGIEFYGKRYAKPVTVGLEALVGRWEATRGTAIAGGAGVNVGRTLEITADGRYRWSSVAGGVVEGRARAMEQTASGKVTIRGATMAFEPDAGTTTMHTFLLVAGSPVTAFSLGGDLFTRADPR